MHHNIYHILHQDPALESWEMYKELEDLAQKLLASGRLRIDAYEYSNFIRFSRPQQNINLVFSHREISDPRLSPRTKKIIKKGLSRYFKGNELKLETKLSFERLEKKVELRSALTLDSEIKIARLVVQATHPSVILLSLVEETEIFVSYDHTVGDMLDIQSWKQVGTSGGLQSTDGKNSSVFISCNGDPLAKNDPKAEKLEYGDGYPAMARLMVIGGQELGHYADIIRDKKGRKFSRHSSNIIGTKATDKAHHYRQNDLRYAHGVLYSAEALGIKEIIKIERHLKFYAKQKRRGYLVNKTKRQHKKLLNKFFSRSKKEGIDFYESLSNDPYKATQIYQMINDMLFNLEPQADAYRSDNPVEEDAIACVEALARVPQQEIKWGKKATKAMMPGLFSLYYEDVIPACISSYEILSGNQYTINKLTKPRTPLKVRIKQLLNKLSLSKSPK